MRGFGRPRDGPSSIRVANGDALTGTKFRRHTPRVYQHLGFQRGALLLWLLTTVVLIPVALALSDGSRQGACTESWATVCASSAPAKSSGPVSHKTVTNQAPHQRAVRTQQTNRP